MECLIISFEKLKIVREVTPHLSFSVLWQPVEREQTTSLFLNEGDAALTFTEMFSFFSYGATKKISFKLLSQIIPLLSGRQMSG